MRSRIVIGAALCLALSNAWGKEDPDECHRLLLEGNAQEKAGQYAAAAGSFLGAVHAAEQARMDPCLLLALNSLARVDDDLGQFAEAERLYKRALAMLKKGGHAEGTSYAGILSNLGALFVEDGQIAAGEAMLRESLAMYARLVPADDERIAATRNGLAEALMRRSKYREAERLLEQALVILENPSNHRGMLAVTLSNLAVLRRMQGRDPEAVPLLERSLAIFESENGRDHPALLRGLNNLATAYAFTKRRDEADATFRRTLAIAEQYLGANHPTYGFVLNNYAEFLGMNGRKAEAKTLAAKARDVLRDSARRNGLGMTVDASALRPK
jgi:tetratricopeptide (TPR) repeat protein